MRRPLTPTISLLTLVAACPPGSETPNATESAASAATTSSDATTGTGFQTVTGNSAPTSTMTAADLGTSGTTADTPTTSSSEPIGECGNGVQEGVELCDDGNADDFDGCTSLCRPPVCGDGILHRDNREECDDGNLDSTDACTEECLLPVCGDGFAQPSAGEECDDGNDSDEDACLNTCAAAACGDGQVWAGVETCDDGFNDNAYNGCAPGCGKLGPHCGDGVVFKIDINNPKGFEYCDTADPYPGVGCTADCLYDFSQVPQMYCRGVCSWAGPKECDQADADTFCKLRTGFPGSVATEYSLGAPTDLGGFPCADPNTAIDINGADPRIWLGPLVEHGVLKSVVYQIDKLKTAHAPTNSTSVILGASLGCTAP